MHSPFTDTLDRALVAGSETAVQAQHSKTLGDCVAIAAKTEHSCWVWPTVASYSPTVLRFEAGGPARFSRRSR